MSVNEPSWVYILANQPRGAIYIGVTSNLIDRIGKHRVGGGKSHTEKYNIKQLVWFEQHGSILSAIAREKKLKR